MSKVFITRRIPEPAESLLKGKGFSVSVSFQDRVLTKDEIIAGAKGCDALLPLLTDRVDGSAMDAIGSQLKIVANYAVGTDNIDLAAAKTRSIAVTNTPGVLTDTVAEFALSLIISVAKRIPEADRFTRAGKYEGWAPELFLGSDLKGKTLGILGAGRIGYEVAMRAHHGFGMHIIYNDIKRGEELEKHTKAVFKETTEDVLREADVVSIHVPLMPSTEHLLNADRLKLMKPTAYLINTSRGPVIDEVALVDALKNGTIRGAGLDVFEFEPKLAKGLAELDNVVITPHIASASEETRNKMSEIVASNVNDFLAGEVPENEVKEA